jgi:CTP:molybdopterin cytidylyltransferase MocA
MEWVLGEAGPGTGYTVAAAAAYLKSRASRLWLHPVDLPAVPSEVIQQLTDMAVKNPETVIVPQHRGQPGHPVILPEDIISLLATEIPSGHLRTWLVQATRPGPEKKAALVTVSVADPGVVTDYDDLGSLRQVEP